MNIVDKIDDYLSLGGMFNPEAMEPHKVRELLFEAREEFTKMKVDYDKLREELYEKHSKSFERLYMSEKYDELTDKVADIIKSFEEEEDLDIRVAFIIFKVMNVTLDMAAEVASSMYKQGQVGEDIAEAIRELKGKYE